MNKKETNSTEREHNAAEIWYELTDFISREREKEHEVEKERMRGGRKESTLTSAIHNHSN